MIKLNDAVSFRSLEGNCLDGIIVGQTFEQKPRYDIRVGKVIHQNVPGSSVFAFLVNFQPGEENALL